MVDSRNRIEEFSKADSIALVLTKQHLVIQAQSLTLSVQKKLDLLL